MPGVVAVLGWESLLRECRNGKKPTKRGTHLFAGFVVCECGTKMYVPSNTPKYVCQKCRMKMVASDLEAVYREQLRDLFVSEEAVRGQLEAADGQLKEKEALLSILLPRRGEKPDGPADRPPPLGGTPQGGFWRPL
jgi:site-specific DNA recombinase